MSWLIWESRRQQLIVDPGFYLNFFVLIVQAFQKVPALKAMAPTQSEPPFLFTQLFALVLFVVLAIVAAIKFRVGPVGTS